MLRPAALECEGHPGPAPCRACDVWGTLAAAATGDVPALRLLLGRDPSLHQAEYWYTQPIDLAVREGHLEAGRLLLEAGADPRRVGLVGEGLTMVARDRGHAAVERLLEDAGRDLSTPGASPADHEIHLAADAGDTGRVRALLEAQPGLVHRTDRAGGTPLHRAVAAQAREVVRLLLDRGASVHARHADGPGGEGGYPPAAFEPIDLALWTGPFWGIRGDLLTARLLWERGANRDLTIAAALGDLHAVRDGLDRDPGAVQGARPCGKRPLSAAVEFGHPAIVRLLFERGADPNAPEGARAPRGAALHAAARAGDRELVELLLAHGADPNAAIDSAGSATYAARTPELRALLLARGGLLSAYDLVWLGDEDEAVRRVAADPRSANRGCGGVLAAACARGRPDLLVRLLDAGARVPSVLTECRSYLLEDPEMLRLLLASGMDPDLPNWQRATPLHDLCGRDTRGRPRPHRTESAAILLDAGASLTARDLGYRSTPLAWASRTDLPDLVDLLLDRGSPVRLPDDDPWATPLAWALRRGHYRIAQRLKAAGATE